MKHYIFLGFSILLLFGEHSNNIRVRMKFKKLEIIIIIIFRLR